MATLDEVESKFLEAARRRDIYATMEAGLHGITVQQATTIIRRLQRRDLIYATRRPKPGFWGSAPAGYRAKE